MLRPSFIDYLPKRPVLFPPQTTDRLFLRLPPKNVYTSYNVHVNVVTVKHFDLVQVDLTSCGPSSARRRIQNK
jgi:hypothetical protein